MMDEHGKIDPTFFSTCRLCVSTPGSYQILPLIQLQIKELFDIKVEAYDGLPQLLCNKCRGFVTKVHTIRCDYQKKQKDLVSRTKGLHAPENIQKPLEGKKENSMVLQNLDFSELPEVTWLDISKVGQKNARGPSAELERAAPTPPIVTTTNVTSNLITSAECDTSSAEPQTLIRDSTDRDCSKNDDSHHDADGANSNDDDTNVDIRRSNSSVPPSVCSSSKYLPKKWRLFYVCKFCNRRFTRVKYLRFHLSIHHDLIELQSHLQIKPCFIAMNRSDENNAQNAVINLREDSKVENAFEHFYILSLHLDADDNKGVNNDSDNVRNLRLKRCRYAETDSEEGTPLNSLKMMPSQPCKLPSPSSSISSLVDDEAELTNASVKSMDVAKPHDKQSELLREHKKQIMSMVRQTFSEKLEKRKRKTSDFLKSDEVAIEYLSNSGGINVLWTNSAKSHHAEFVINRSFAPTNGGFYPPPKRPYKFIDLSMVLRNTTQRLPSVIQEQPSIIQLNQQESNQQPIESQNVTVASINFDTEMSERTVSPSLILNQTTTADDGPCLSIIEVRSLRNDGIFYLSDDERMDGIHPTTMTTTSEQTPVTTESMPSMTMAAASEQMPIILNTQSLAVVPPPPPEANFDVPIVSNFVNNKLKTYNAKRKPPLEPQIPAAEPMNSLIEMLQRPMGVKPSPELIRQRPLIKCKPTSLLLPRAPIPNEAPPPPYSSTVVTLADFRAALNAQGFQLVEDTKSNEFTTLIRYNIHLYRSTHNSSLMVSLFVCRSESTTFCIQVRDAQGMIAIHTKPALYQSQVIKSLLESEVVKNFKSHVKALSSVILNNTLRFIHIGRMLAGLEPS